MRNGFYLNNDYWDIQIVKPDDPVLTDRTGKHTVATTDPSTKSIYLSTLLYGDFLARVFIHELGHCAMISFNLLPELHRLVPQEYWIDVEEWACNFIADYGLKIYNIAREVFGFNAWKYIPNELNKWQQLRR